MEFLYLAGLMACFILSAFSIEAGESIAQEVLIAIVSSALWPLSIWRLIHATYR